MAVFSKIPMYSKVNAGQIIFTSSQMWEVPRGVKKADVFLVGGAGGGGRGMVREYTDSMLRYENFGGAGGGGGYTATYLDVDVTPKSLVDIIIGAGGAMSNDGNPSSFGLLSVVGGKAGKDAAYYHTATGGDGGSGGGAGRQYTTTSGLDGSGTQVVRNGTNGSGGTNGSNGGNSYDNIISEYILNTGGKGQGVTTRAFGEISGVLYASGGAGGAISERDGDFTIYHGAGGNGSTTSEGNPGIVIVRWAEQ